MTEGRTPARLPSGSPPRPRLLRGLRLPLLGDCRCRRPSPAPGAAAEPPPPPPRLRCAGGGILKVRWPRQVPVAGLRVSTGQGGLTGSQGGANWRQGWAALPRLPAPRAPDGRLSREGACCTPGPRSVRGRGRSVRPALTGTTFAVALRWSRSGAAACRASPGRARGLRCGSLVPVYLLESRGC